MLRARVGASTQRGHPSPAPRQTPSEAQNERGCHDRQSQSFPLSGCAINPRILLANLLQSSRSTFSWESFPSFFAFQEGMWDTQISAFLSSPTVTHEPGLSTAYKNRGAIFRRVSPLFFPIPLYVTAVCKYYYINQL